MKYTDAIRAHMFADALVQMIERSGDLASPTVAGREPSQSPLSRPSGRPSTIAKGKSE